MKIELEKFMRRVNCEFCMHCIEYTDEDKWENKCPECGRSKKELIKLEVEYWEINNGN